MSSIPLQPIKVSYSAALQSYVCFASSSTNINTFTMTLCPGFSLFTCQEVIDILRKVAFSKLDGIGHALSVIKLQTTPKRCMQHDFKGATRSIVIHLSSCILQSRTM